jgi:hypothetical protein
MSLESRLCCERTYLIDRESLFDLLDTLLNTPSVVCSSDKSLSSILCLERPEDVSDRDQLPDHEIIMSIKCSEHNENVVTSQEQRAVLSHYHRSSSRSTYPVFY